MESKSLTISLILFFTVLFGVPLWYQWTSIHRAEIPFDVIQEIVDRQVGEWPIEIVIHYPKTLSDSEFVGNIKSHLRDMLNANFIEKSLPSRVDVSALTYDEVLIQKVKSDPKELDEVLHKYVGDKEGQYHLFLLDGNSNKGWIGQYRNLWIESTFKESLLPYALSMFEHILLNTSPLPKPSSSYRLSFTLLNGNPEDHTVSWNFTDISEQYDSQLKFYARPQIEPEKRGNNFVFTLDALPYFFDSTGWNIGSDQHSIDQCKFDFVLYVPPKDITPLYLLDNMGSPQKTNGFTIGEWGGSVIYNIVEEKPLKTIGTGAEDNVSKTSNSTGNSSNLKKNSTDNEVEPSKKELKTSEKIVRALDVTNIKKEVSVWISQIRQLLGFPPLQQKLMKNGMQIEVLYPKGKGATLWELDTLARTILLKNIKETKKTFDAFSKMIQTLSKLPIQDSIRSQLDESINGLTQIEKAIGKENSYAAKRLSDQVLISLESIFFDQNMVAPIQFPDEHYMAIYLPLFGPVAINIFRGLYYGLKEKRKAKVE